MLVLCRNLYLTIFIWEESGISTLRYIVLSHLAFDMNSLQLGGLWAPAEETTWERNWTTDPENKIHMELLLFLVLSKLSANAVWVKHYMIYIWRKVILKSSSDPSVSVSFMRPSSKEYQGCFRFQIPFSIVLFLSAVCVWQALSFTSSCTILTRQHGRLEAFRVFVIPAVLFLIFANLDNFLTLTEPYFAHLKRDWWCLYLT